MLLIESCASCSSTVTTTTIASTDIIHVNTHTDNDDYNYDGSSVNSNFHTKIITTTNAHTKTRNEMLAEVQSTIILLINYNISCFSNTGTPIDTVYYCLYSIHQ